MNEYFDKIFNTTKIPFDLLIGIIWGAFLLVFLAVIIGGHFSKKIKGASKKPFLSFLNVFTALNFAAFLLKSEIPQAFFSSALFWIIGYILYGILCVLSRDKAKTRYSEGITLTELPAIPLKPAREVSPSPQPAAKSSVRLEHAISVTDKLLQKNLGKTDRQELEKLKNTLAVLQLKGTLSSAEADILNENFNTLLKLRAKYNI